MFSVEEVAQKLGVSKVTIYSKLKKFDDKVVLKQGKKYITDELLTLIKQDLKIKNIENNNFKSSTDTNETDEAAEEVAADIENLNVLNKELIDTLIEQLKEKDKQIEKLHNLIENNQVLLREKPENIKELEEHFQELDNKLIDVKVKMDQRKQKSNKGFFKKIFRKS